ncbi:hypothetical protein LM602_02335 [Candidatus Acetothermia bacterium]|nr:hypothetical protein [Candidatus Acetothermia bacterium]MCI2431383.1 hypothetical protein [Candidatus Acetothermia bacterium]MCI2435831.1 hypothetical protein [Candidatus Acetothermia bacterium]
MAERASLNLRVKKSVRRKLERIAKAEHRSLSAQAELALTEWLCRRDELHPQFVQEIKEALEGVARGEVEPVWK